MATILIVIFIVGYLFIALQHNLHIDKAASALLTGTLCWAALVLGRHEVPEHLGEAYSAFTHGGDHGGHGALKVFFEHRLLHHMEEISSILFFLLGAMTIVELVDAHNGFSVITDKITTRKKGKLLWIIGILTFFFSAALDNLTTSIVMISLLRKLIADKPTRWLYAGAVIILSLIHISEPTRPY